MTRTTTRRFLLGGLVLLAGGLALGVPPAAGEEGASELLTEVVDVGALTRGVTYFIPGHLGTVPTWQYGDTESPLFGAEGEEPFLPCGTIDELIELLKETVDPVFWEVTEGADVRGWGEHRLVVRATAEVIAALKTRLVALERSALTTVHFDFVTIRTEALPRDAAAPLAPEVARRLLEEGAVGRVLSISALADQSATAWSGSQRAYIQDYEVEVASKATIADPVVGVVRHGLEVRVSAVPSGEKGMLQVTIHAQIAEPLPDAWHTRPEDQRIDLPRYRAQPILFERVVEGGRWYVAPGVLGGEGPTALLYRVRAVEPAVGAAPASPMPAWPAPDTDALETRFIDVRDLNLAPRHQIGDDAQLVPSGFTPPEPPELGDPMPLYPIDSLVDFLTERAPSRTWSRTGTFLEARGGRLIVRQTPAVLDAIEAHVGQLRDRVLVTTTVTLDLLDLPTRLALALEGAPERETDVALRGRALDGLDAALSAGDARRVARARLSLLGGARKTAAEGAVRHYLQDYEVEIAEDAVVADPSIRSFFDGVVAELAADRSSDGSGVLVELRFTASRLEEMKAATTPHGPIDAPTLAMLRSRSSVFVPVGRTALVLAGGEGERTRVLLLTPTLEKR